MLSQVLTSDIETNKVVNKNFKVNSFLTAGYTQDLCQDIIRDLLIIRNGRISLNNTVSTNLTHTTNTFSIALRQIGMEELQNEKQTVYLYFGG